MGKGRWGVLGVESPDPVLSLLGALGLGQSVGTALVVDLRGDMAVDSRRTLADLAAEGPTRAELSPARTGVALISAGPLPDDQSAEVVDLLARGWPAVVIRCDPGRWPGPVVPVRAILPGLLRPTRPGPSVWQPTSGGGRPGGPGPVLPTLRPGLVRNLLAGRTVPRARWIRAWAPVWEMPWG